MTSDVIEILAQTIPSLTVASRLWVDVGFERIQDGRLYLLLNRVKRRGWLFAVGKADIPSVPQSFIDYLLNRAPRDVLRGLMVGSEGWELVILHESDSNKDLLAMKSASGRELLKSDLMLFNSRREFSERSERRLINKSNITSISALQHGVFSFAQAIEAGYKKPNILRNVRLGRWHKIIPNVYTDLDLPPQPERLSLHQKLAILSFFARDKFGRVRLIASGVSALMSIGVLTADMDRPLDIAIHPSIKKKPDLPFPVVAVRRKLLHNEVEEAHGYFRTNLSTSLLMVLSDRELGMQYLDAIIQGLRKLGLLSVVKPIVEGGTLPGPVSKKLFATIKESSL